MQRLVEPAPAAVTGEELPGPVGAVRCWGQADDEQAAMRIAKPRYRPAPILFLGKLPLLDLRNGATVAAKPRATIAMGYLLGQAG